MTHKLIIIGSGPAAHTAAIYSARAHLAPLMFEGIMAGGVAAGGQLTTTTEVENFPGFPDGIAGPELMDRMRQQSVKCATVIKTQTVDKVDFKSHPFKVYSDGETYETHAVILATGATAKRMNVPGEEKFWQKGISACAVCDGALPFFRNKELVVIGGGDTAAEEATFLTKYASKVYVVHRRDTMRASQAMQDRLFSNPKINMVWNSILTSVAGDKKFEGVNLQNVLTKQESLLPAGGLFYAIGHVPNTDFLEGQIELDDTKYIKTKPGTTLTNVPGVFACGDVQDKVYRQAITAAGTGCMAALEAEKYLHQHSK
jgi:thioredoxin reductase (NADPH)